MLNGFLHGGSSFMVPVVFVFSAMYVASTMVLHHFLYMVSRVHLRVYSFVLEFYLCGSLHLSFI